MGQEKFKLPRSSYPELCKIIQAYGNLEKPDRLDALTRGSGIGKFTISANAAFLSAVEIIEGGKYKIATDKGRKLAKALEHELSEEIMKAWRTVVEGNEFLNKMVMAVRIRKGMEISSLEAHIAYSAGEQKAQQVMTGTRTVIDILRNSGLVKEANDRIVAEDIIAVEEPVSQPEGKPTKSETELAIREVSKTAGISLHIELRINATPAELEGLGEKLKAMIEDLSKGEAKVENTDENAVQEG
jgi:hypothetical protein